jgi:predicted esterase YcpF (UPF0227 family)
MNASILYEIDSINKELTRLKKRVSELNKRKKTLTDKIITNLQETGETSISYNGKTYKLTEKHITKNIKPLQAKPQAIQILQELGIEDYQASEVFEKLTQTIKGEEKIVFKLQDK